MKNKLFIILFLSLLQNLFAQNYIVDTTITINKNKFRIQTTENSSKDLILNISINSKIRLKEKIDNDGLFSIEFIDFNNDKYKDIVFTYSDNYNSLYLFDPKKNNFSKVEGFEKYSDAIQLKSNPNYYYSYHKAGCADYNWTSDLFLIQDFKTKHIGYIFANGCESETNLESLKTYKVLNNNQNTKKLIDNLNYAKNLPSIAMKWEFIKQYWNKNYKKYK